MNLHTNQYHQSLLYRVTISWPYDHLNLWKSCSLPISIILFFVIFTDIVTLLVLFFKNLWVFIKLNILYLEMFRLVSLFSLILIPFSFFYILFTLNLKLYECKSKEDKILWQVILIMTLDGKTTFIGIIISMFFEILRWFLSLLHILFRLISSAYFLRHVIISIIKFLCNYKIEKTENSSLYSSWNNNWF